MKALRVFSVVLLSGMIALSAGAQEKEKKKNRKARGKRATPEQRAVDQAFSFLSKVELTADQKAQVADLKKKHSAKIAEVAKARGAVLTAEQKQTQREAGKKARDAGKKGKDLRDAVNAALKLSKEQDAKLKAANKAFADVGKAVRADVMAILTDEQKKSLRGNRNKKAADKPKKRNKKKDAE